MGAVPGGVLGAGAGRERRAECEGAHGAVLPACLPRPGLSPGGWLAFCADGAACLPACLPTSSSAVAPTVWPRGMHPATAHLRAPAPAPPPTPAGLLAPFLFNYGLTAAAEALCQALALPGDECADLW